MKLTPLDIHHKEFHRSLRGYNEEEVDSFLDIVAEEFERLFKENVELNEQVDGIREKLARFQNIEQTLQNTLVSAQKSAEEVQKNARQKSELLIKEAELKTKEVLQGVQGERQRIEANYETLKQEELKFREEFRAMLQMYLRKIEEFDGRRPVSPEAEAEKAGEDLPEAVAVEGTGAEPGQMEQPITINPQEPEAPTATRPQQMEQPTPTSPEQPERPTPTSPEQPEPSVVSRAQLGAKESEEPVDISKSAIDEPEQELPLGGRSASVGPSEAAQAADERPQNEQPKQPAMEEPIPIADAPRMAPSHDEPFGEQPKIEENTSDGNEEEIDLLDDEVRQVQENVERIKREFSLPDDDLRPEESEQK